MLAAAITRQCYGHRAFSSSACRGSLRSLDRHVFLFHRELINATDDPFWKLQHGLAAVLHVDWKHTKTQSLISDAGVDVNEFEKFGGVLKDGHNITSALARLQELGVNAPALCEQNGQDVAERDLFKAGVAPPWLTMYLVARKVRIPEHALHSLPCLVHSHLPFTPMHLQPPLLIFAILALCSMRVEAPVSRMLDVFLSTPLPDPWLHMNLVLAALARAPSEAHHADNIIRVLQAMRSRSIPLRGNTYLRLLSDPRLTMRLTRVLQAQMVHQGFIPKAEHLEMLLRVFAREGAAGESTHYLQAIHALEQTNGDSAPLTSANTTHLTGLARTPISGYAYLRDMLKKAPVGKSIFSIYLRSYRWSSIRPKLRSRRRLFPKRKLVPKSNVDVYDWTAALTAAARNCHVSAARLLKIFRHGNQSLPATVVTYTTVIRGLIYRNAFDLAEDIWVDLRRTRTALDDKALTVGLQLLARSGRPHVAFSLLELTVAPQPSRTGRRIGRRAVSHVRPSVILMNEFMASLLRGGRPDAVFVLWDTMHILYHVRPDAATLDILLKAAAAAARKDDSISGAWAAFTSPMTETPPLPKTREEAVEAVRQVLGDMSAPRPYKHGRWHGRPSWVTASTIFRTLLLRTHPELAATQPPAVAVRASAHITPLRELAGVLFPPPIRSLDSKQDNAIQSTEHALGMRFTSRVFHSYIHIVGIKGAPGEIPLALAWARAIGLKPYPATLPLSLVLFGEVSMRSPMFGNDYGEYGKLRRWIDDWCRESKTSMVTDLGIHNSLRILEKLKSRGDLHAFPTNHKRVVPKQARGGIRSKTIPGHRTA